MLTMTKRTQAALVLMLDGARFRVGYQYSTYYKRMEEVHQLVDFDLEIFKGYGYSTYLNLLPYLEEAGKDEDGYFQYYRPNLAKLGIVT